MYLNGDLCFKSLGHIDTAIILHFHWFLLTDTMWTLYFLGSSVFPEDGNIITTKVYRKSYVLYQTLTLWMTWLKLTILNHSFLHFRSSSLFCWSILVFVISKLLAQHSLWNWCTVRKLPEVEHIFACSILSAVWMWCYSSVWCSIQSHAAWVLTVMCSLVSCSSVLSRLLCVMFTVELVDMTFWQCCRTAVHTQMHELLNVNTWLLNGLFEDNLGNLDS